MQRNLFDKNFDPTVSAYLRPIFERGSVVNYQALVICPYCGEYHAHGVGSPERPTPGASIGHRQADCPGGGGYYVKVT